MFIQPLKRPTVVPPEGDETKTKLFWQGALSGLELESLEQLRYPE